MGLALNVLGPIAACYVLEQGGRGGPEDTYPAPTAVQLARWRGLTELALDFGDEALALLATL